MRRIVFVVRDTDQEIELPPPHDASSRTIAVPGIGCPCCKARELVVAGRNPREGDDDRTYVSDAYCVACDKRAGRLVVEASTIFGLKEDRAVLQGRPRVY